ncbi:hypothetical protein GOP47_0004787 [Adiantum capillus-veneris]|uniref:Germin-like protein n=1 Tax=Adiantum capillus-veneris TaxID=13818 RepID=A0A9D4V4X5_ADICA|nr:hypothetical protein GOP47_0004787 [Adiantum capillus-veneris]
MATSLAALSVSSIVVLLISMSCMQIALASDPDPLVDIPAGLTSFTLRDIFTNGDVSVGPGGTRATVNVNIFPAMESQSLTYTQFRMRPCGVNLPHTHPRASEMLTLVSGGPPQVGFVDTEGDRHIDILYPGDVTIFPRGLLHFELNVGKRTALNSQNPGVLTAAGALLNIPTRALATSLNSRIQEVQELEQNMLVHGSDLEMPPPSVCTPGQNITIDF